MKPTHHKMTRISSLDTSPTRIPSDRPTRTGAPHAGHVRARVRPVGRAYGSVDRHADGHSNVRTGGGRAPADVGLQQIRPLLVSAQFFQIGSCSRHPLPSPNRRRRFVEFSSERRLDFFVGNIDGGTSV